MAGIFRTSSSFTVTPHKISICLLLQIYASPSSIFHRLVSTHHSSTSARNLLGLFLFSLTKSCDSPEEPSFNFIESLFELIFGSQNHAAFDHLRSVLSSFDSPDHLFVFFNDLRQLLDRIASISLLDDPLFLDSSSDLGLFLRRCILSFDHLRFESLSILLSNIISYTNSTSNPPFRYPRNEAPPLQETLGQIGIENFEEMKSFTNSTSNSPNRNPRNEAPPLPAAITAATAESRLEETLGRIGIENFEEMKSYTNSTSNSPNRNPRNEAPPLPAAITAATAEPRLEETLGRIGIEKFEEIKSDVFLRSSSQLQGYLTKKADKIEKYGCNFSSKTFDLDLKLLEILSPDLQRIHYLRFLNSFYSSDYPTALENLHRYFDYTAGIEDFDFKTLNSSPHASGCWVNRFVVVGVSC